MDPVRELMIIEAIRRLKARYFRAIDAKDWTAYRATFTDDAVLDVSGEAHDGAAPPLIKGGDALVRFVSAQLRGVTTVHSGCMDEINVIDPVSATGIWAMRDLLIWSGNPPIRRLEGFGHYHEKYQYEHSAWKISELRLTRVHVDLYNMDRERL